MALKCFDDQRKSDLSSVGAGQMVRLELSFEAHNQSLVQNESGNGRLVYNGTMERTKKRLEYI